MPTEFPDVVVLVPGITGSVLERNGREVWGTSAEAVLRGLLSGGQSVQDLILGDDDPYSLVHLNLPAATDLSVLRRRQGRTGSVD